MPRGGNHGGGRPKKPPEIKAKTYSYCFSPILGDAIAAIGDNASHSIQAIVLKYFGITPLQWEIYTVWIECDRKVIATAEKLGRDPENIRQVVAKVERKLKTQFWSGAQRRSFFCADYPQLVADYPHHAQRNIYALWGWDLKVDAIL